MADDPILVVDRLEKRFGGNRAVDGASFSVQRGSITGLIGPNGAGKTTCFYMIVGLVQADQGRVLIDDLDVSHQPMHRGRVTFAGRDITGQPSHRIFRHGLVRTFQIPQELGRMTVIENLMLVPAGQTGERLWEPLLRPWRVRAEEQANAERAHEVLRQMTQDHLALEPAANLSGGQRKLLELARALMATPKMILLDEPSAGVNPTLAQRLVDDILGIRRDTGVTFLVIGHDMDVIARLSDHVVVMAAGQVLTQGTPDEVLSNTEVQEAYLGGQVR
ncbi:MAG: ABC transporter ATP-binding protein [Chloroflexi bacterium]|nr:ABC transporter ATP-binding protein [Chloroflexota bacterium]